MTYGTYTLVKAISMWDLDRPEWHLEVVRTDKSFSGLLAFHPYNLKIIGGNISARNA